MPSSCLVKRCYGIQLYKVQMCISPVPRPSNVRTSPAPQLQKRGNEKRVERVWKITMPGSVLMVGILPRMDEGKNVSPANQRSSSTNDRKQIYGRT